MIFLSFSINRNLAKFFKLCSKSSFCPILSQHIGNGIMFLFIVLSVILYVLFCYVCIYGT